MSFAQRLTAGRPGRLLLGILAAALVACLTPLPVMLLMGAIFENWSQEFTAGLLGEFATASTAMVIVLPGALMMTVAAGLPVHLALAALDWQGRLAYALGGAVAGGVLLGGLIFGQAPFAAIGAVSGLLAGLAFRGIWRP